METDVGTNPNHTCIHAAEIRQGNIHAKEILNVETPLFSSIQQTRLTSLALTLKQDFDRFTKIYITTFRQFLKQAKAFNHNDDDDDDDVTKESLCRVCVDSICLCRCRCFISNCFVLLQCIIKLFVKLV